MYNLLLQIVPLLLERPAGVFPFVGTKLHSFLSREYVSCHEGASVTKIVFVEVQ